MKKYILLIVIVLAFGMNANAQDIAMVDNSVDNTYLTDNSSVDEYSRFNTEQKIQVRKKSAEFLNLDIKKVSLSSGIVYNNNFFWKIRLRENRKTKFLFFQSDKSFSNIKKKECRLEPLLELAKKE